MSVEVDEEVVQPCCSDENSSADEVFWVVVVPYTDSV